MDGPRAPSETEFPHIVRFLDSQLRPAAGWSITSEYPTALHPTNLSNIRIIMDKDQVLSHAVMRPLIVKTPAGLFKIGGIGSVVTSESHRNQGLSTKTLESCIEAAREAGCDFAILWTSLHDFYRRLGFELAGTEVSFVIDREIDLIESESKAPLKFMDSTRVAPEAIHRLYSQHTVSSLRTVDETRRYLQIPNTRLYTAWDAHGALKAYAVEGKGADLTGYIHEWGGSVSALMALFSHIQKETKKTRGAGYTIIVPRHSANLIRTLESKGFRANYGCLGMIKILNWSNLIGKIQRHARHFGIDDFVFERQGADSDKSNSITSSNFKFKFGTKAQTFETDSELDIVRLVFGPRRLSELVPPQQLNPDACKAIETVFPLSMWIWGWDSV
jgi:GNAT superfamily N-acetyltransferase